MKIITAIIKPAKLEEVTNAIREIGAAGITITEVKGSNRQRDHTEFYRGTEYDIQYTPKIRIDIAVNDKMQEQVTQVIQNSTESDKLGEGKIFIVELEEIVRIRTGDSGPGVL